MQLVIQIIDRYFCALYNSFYMDTELKQQFKKIDKNFDDVLQAVKVGFDEVYGRFDDVYDKFDGVYDRLDKVESDIKVIKGTMPTKEYIDDKLADLGAEIGRRINRAYEEQRLFAVKLVEFLKADRALKKDHVEQLEEMLA